MNLMCLHVIISSHEDDNQVVLFSFSLKFFALVCRHYWSVVHLSVSLSQIKCNRNRFELWSYVCYK